MTDAQSEADRQRKRPAPLVWVILGLVVLMVVLIVLGTGGHDRTPQGGTMPAPPQEDAVMPPAPASGDAPATPGSVRPSSDQPAVR